MDDFIILRFNLDIWFFVFSTEGRNLESKQMVITMQLVHTISLELAGILMAIG